MATALDMNADALRNTLGGLPNLAALAVSGRSDLRKLANAWQLGATERSEVHPLIQLIYGREHEARLAELEAGLPMLELSTNASDFRERIVQDHRGAHAPAVAALSELMVGVRLRNAGATVHFVKAGGRRGIRTPDIAASRDGVQVTLEVMSFHEADAAKAVADADHAAFMAWKASEPVPARLKGRASTRPGLKMMESDRQTLGQGDPSRRAYALTRKLREKADWGQLSGKPNPILVVACWHVFGIDRTDFEPDDPLEATSPYRAAVYGRLGDTVTDGIEFEGGSLQTWRLASDGVVRAPGDAAALLWLFQKGQPLLAKRTVGSTPSLDPRAEKLVVEAFDPVILEP